MPEGLNGSYLYKHRSKGRLAIHLSPVMYPLQPTSLANLLPFASSGSHLLHAALQQRGTCSLYRNRQVSETCRVDLYPLQVDTLGVHLLTHLDFADTGHTWRD